MTGIEIYLKAMASLGYADQPSFKKRAVVCLNQIYEELFCLVGEGEFEPIKTLSDKVCLPEGTARTALVYGLAERLSLGSSDGELQQYFARQYDIARARLTKADRVTDVLPRA